MKIVNYKKSLLNLVSSIIKYYNYPTNHDTLDLVYNKLLNNYKNVVLLVFDGLGDKNLNTLSESGILNKYKADVIDSVYPPTTVAAITTLESGLAPIEHAWLGWTLYFKEFDQFINIFPYVDAYTKEAINIEERSGKDLIRYKSIFSKIRQGTNDNVERYVLYPDKIYRDEVDYTVFPCKDLTQFFNNLETLCKKDGRKYIYGYWPEPDYTMHEFGVDSILVKKCVENIEEKLEEIIDSLEDSLVIITADHGHINVIPKYLSDYPSILNCLKRPISLEGRTVSFFIKNDKEAEFEKEFETAFGNDFKLLKKEEVLRDDLFGHGNIHEKALDFIGDYLALATKDILLYYQKTDFVMKGAHAGSTSAEIKVPLIIIEKK